MEEVGIKPDKLECGTGSPFAACLNGLAPGMNPASYMREITILPRIGITAQPVRLEGSAIVSYNVDKGIVPSVFSVGKDYRSLGSVRIGCRPDRHVGIVSGTGCLLFTFFVPELKHLERRLIHIHQRPPVDLLFEYWDHVVRKPPSHLHQPGTHGEPGESRIREEALLPVERKSQCILVVDYVCKEGRVTDRAVKHVAC